MYNFSSVVYLVTWSTSICIVSFHDVIKGWRVQTLLCLNSTSLAKGLQSTGDALNMLGSPSETQIKSCLKKIEKNWTFFYWMPPYPAYHISQTKKKWLKTLSQTCNYAETQTTPKRVRFSPSSEQLFFLHFSKEKKINMVIFLFIFLWRVDLIELRKEKEKGYENDADGFLSGSGRQNQ